MTAYYNEIDPVAAQWLRNLIGGGHIAPGDVDERSIEDVRPDDLISYTQCHFFAGIGIWSYAARRAGWSDDTPVWTGSCPCQPFSAAGKGGGFDDERHLWPAWHYLIEQCRPPVIFGEQVASKDGYGWLDLVQTDLEGLGYACGAVVSPAAGYGAPHIRHRTYFVADTLHAGRTERGTGAGSGSPSGRSGIDGLADSSMSGPFGRRSGETGDGRGKARIEPERFCASDQLAYPDDERRQHGAAVARSDGAGTQSTGTGPQSGAGRIADKLVNAVNAGLEGYGGHVNSGDEPGWLGTDAAGSVAEAGAACVMGITNSAGSQQGRQAIAATGYGDAVDAASGSDALDHATGARCDAEIGGPEGEARDGARLRVFGEGCDARELGHAPYKPCERDARSISGAEASINGTRVTVDGCMSERPEHAGPGVAPRPGPVNGPWRNADWLGCTDGKWRPVESGTFPLAHGAAGRVGRLRAYGNGLCAEQAEETIRAYRYMIHGK